MPSHLSASLRSAAAVRSGGNSNTSGSRAHPHNHQESHLINEESLYDESLENSVPASGASHTATNGSFLTVSSSQLPSSDAAAASSTFIAAADARRAWQAHGVGLSSALEEKRLRGPTVVRILGAADRYDASHARFTAYPLQVSHGRTQHDNATVLSSVSTPTMNNQATSTWTVERRYSDFCKLHEIVRQHSVELLQDDRSPVGFPGKHWAGRMGNWTPSLMWAPEKHDELVRYRITQLDIWLVHLVEWYNRQCALSQPQQQPYATLLSAIWQFLTEPFRPPCHQDNTSLQNPQAAKDWKWNNPFSFSLNSSIRQATLTISNMTAGRQVLHGGGSNQVSSRHPSVYDADRTIPLDLLHAARGLVFMTVLKAGLMVSGRVGTGLVVARLDGPRDRGSDDTAQAIWSAPCALGTVGMGWGALIGGDVTHYLVVLTTEKAVTDLVSSNSIQLGAELGVAVGPLGRGANGHLATGDWTLHPAYAYAHSQGLFAGISLEGSLVTVRNDVNSKFYACPCNAKEILRQRGPKAAEPLYQALNQAMTVPIPEGSFRPTQFFSPEKGAMNPCSSFPVHEQGNPAPTPPHRPAPSEGRSSTPGRRSHSKHRQEA